MTNIQLYIQLKVLVFSKVIVSSKLLITVYLSYFLSNKIFLNLLPETMILVSFKTWMPVSYSCEIMLNKEGMERAKNKHSSKLYVR